MPATQIVPPLKYDKTNFKINQLPGPQSSLHFQVVSSSAVLVKCESLVLVVFKHI